MFVSCTDRLPCCYRDFLPRGSGIVTRRPLVLQLMNCPTGKNICGGSCLPGHGMFWACRYKAPTRWFKHLQQNIYPSITPIVLVFYLTQLSARPSSLCSPNTSPQHSSREKPSSNIFFSQFFSADSEMMTTPPRSHHYTILARYRAC